MNKTTILSIILITALLFVPAASASFLGDVNTALDNGIKTLNSGIKGLSLIGTQTVRCDDGSTTCGATGEIFTISSSVMTGDSKLELVIPTSKTFTLDEKVIKITAPLTLTIIPREPVLRIPLTSSKDYIYKYAGFANFLKSEPINAFTPYGDGLITTKYGIQISDISGTSGITEASYNYQNPSKTNTVLVHDNAGNVATITAKHQNSGGIVPNMAIIVVSDSNGAGGYSVFDRSTFSANLDKQNQIEEYRLDIWNRPKSWQEFLERLKTEQGLTRVPVGNQNVYSMDGSYLYIIYTEDSIGTQVEARFPKTMVSFVTELISNGKPQIISAELAPPELTFGQGSGLLTVVVKNAGSTDKISVYLNTATEFSATGGGVQTIIAGDTATYYFTVNLLGNKESMSNIRVTATAAGSGNFAIKDIGLKGHPSKPDAKVFKMSITGYAPDKSILSEAPIIVNEVQRCKGYCTIDVTDGITYIIKSKDIGAFFAPSSVTRITGNTPEDVALYFTTAPPPPQGADLTWIFWGILAIILIYAGYRTGLAQMILKNPWFLIPLVIIIFMFWIIWQIFQVLMGVKASLDEAYVTISTLGGLL